MLNVIMQEYVRRDPEIASILFAFKLCMLQMFHPLPHLSRERAGQTSHTPLGPESPYSSTVINMWGFAGDSTTPGCGDKNNVQDTMPPTRTTSVLVQDLTESKGGSGGSPRNGGSCSRCRKLLQQRAHADISSKEADREDASSSWQELEELKNQVESLRAQLRSAEEREKERKREQEREHRPVNSLNDLAGTRCVAR
jgi:hypothetical protein